MISALGERQNTNADSADSVDSDISIPDVNNGALIQIREFLVRACSGVFAFKSRVGESRCTHKHRREKLNGCAVNLYKSCHASFDHK